MCRLLHRGGVRVTARERSETVARWMAEHHPGTPVDSDLWANVLSDKATAERVERALARWHERDHLHPPTPQDVNEMLREMRYSGAIGKVRGEFERHCQLNPPPSQVFAEAKARAAQHEGATP